MLIYALIPCQLSSAHSGSTVSGTRTPFFYFNPFPSEQIFIFIQVKNFGERNKDITSEVDHYLSNTESVMMTDLHKEKIFSLLKEHKRQLTKFGVAKIGLFGSYVRDENEEASDVDILVEFEAGKKNYDNFIQLVFFLEDLFQKDVDLLTMESMSPYLKPFILKEVQFEAISEP